VIQVSGIRCQESDQLAAASPPKKINEMPIGFHLIPYYVFHAPAERWASHSFSPTYTAENGAETV
jgi:hypothetical protein